MRLAILASVSVILGLWEKQKAHKLVMVPMNDARRINVILPCYAWDEARITIRSLLERAHLARRVSVHAVVNPLEVSQSEAEAEFKDYPLNVSITMHPRHYNLGGIIASNYIIERLNMHGDTLVLLMHCHSVMCADWDLTLIESLSGAYESGSHVVTQVPLEVPKSKHVTVLQPTFPVLHTDTVTNRIPTFAARVFASAGRQYPSLSISAKCLFGELDIVQRIIQHAVPLTSSHETDFILSATSFALGIKAVTPLRSVLQHITDTRRHSYLDNTSDPLGKFKDDVITQLLNGKSDNSLQMLIAYLGVHCDAFIKSLGIDVFSGKLLGHLILGVSKEHTDRELVDKYGSVQRYKEFRSLFCFD